MALSSVIDEAKAAGVSLADYEGLEESLLDEQPMHLGIVSGLLRCMRCQFVPDVVACDLRGPDGCAIDEV